MKSKLLKLYLLFSLLLFIVSVSGLLYETLESYNYNIFTYLKVKRDYFMLIPVLLLSLSMFSFIFNFNKFASLRISSKLTQKLFRAIDFIFSILLILASIVGLVFTLIITDNTNESFIKLAVFINVFLFVLGVVLCIDNRKFSIK